MKKWIVTLGGAGLLPFGPGTWGSALTSVCLLFIHLLLERAGLGTGPSRAAWPIALIAGLILFSGLSVWLGPWAMTYFRREDPGPFVLDEAAGICLTMFLLPQFPGWTEAWPVVTAFAAFRIFDISKPPPARQLEHLPGGWGILLDDLMAAVYANLLCQVVLRWLLPVVLHRGTA